MPTNTYDLIVIGDDFAGMIAAALCAQRGMRVLIIESGNNPVSYKLGPYKLPVRALAFVGWGSPAVQRVLEELRLDHLLKRKLKQRVPSFQLVAPNARINVTPDELSMSRELNRELPESEILEDSCQRAHDIAQMLDTVLGHDITFPPSGFWERREVGKNSSKLADEAAAWFAQIDDDDVVRSLLELPSVLGTRCNPFALTPECRARAFDLWRQGTPRIRGDWAVLREIFIEKLEQHSGEMRIARVDELIFSWGKAAGVRLEGGEELGAEHIVAATSVDEIVRIAERKLPKRLTQCDEQIAPSGYRYTLNMVVAEAGIPEGMASTVLVVADPEAPLIGRNAFAIYLSEPDDEARVIVTVEAVASAPDDDQQLADVLADLRVGLRESLEMVMPFLSEHVLLAHSPHENLPAEEVEGALELAHAIEPQPVWNSTIESYLGVSAVPYSVGVKHLTVASSQVLTGLGVEGDFTTGWCAAKIASGSAGKKKSETKSELLAAK